MALAIPEAVAKPHSIHEIGPIDVSGLLSLMGRLSEKVWELEDARKDNNFDVFHHTRHIVFRFIHGNRDPREFYSKPIWDVWKPTLLPIMEQATEGYGYQHREYPKAMLARLAAGHLIDPHIDGNGSNLSTHKIHIPLETNEKAIFMSNGEKHHLKPGIAYEVNNIASHCAQNHGDTDRIHFIFEVFDAKPE